MRQITDHYVNLLPLIQHVIFYASNLGAERVIHPMIFDSFKPLNREFSYEEDNLYIINY